MKTKRQFWSGLVALCLMLTLVPTMAMSADTTKDILTDSDSVTYELSDTDGTNDTITFSGNGEITRQILNSFFLSVSAPEYKDKAQIKYIVIEKGVTGTEKNINNYNAVFPNAERVTIHGKGNFSFGNNFFRKPATKGLSVVSERDSLEIGTSAFEGAILTDFPIEQLKRVKASGFKNATLPMEGNVLKLFFKDNIDLTQMSSVHSVGEMAFSGVKNKDGINFTSAEITIAGNVILGNPSYDPSTIFGSSDTIENLKFILTDKADFRLVSGAVAGTKKLSFEGTGSVGFAYQHHKSMRPISGLNKAAKLETIDFQDFKGHVIFPRQTLGRVGSTSYDAAEKGVLSSVFIGEGCNVQIEENAFDGVKALETFEFSKGTACFIGQYAFRNTSLIEVDLSNVSSIGYCAFDNVTGVSDWSSINTAAGNGRLKKLEYSNVFLNTDSVWRLVQKEMDGKFALNQNGDYAALTPSNNGWEDTKEGAQNATDAASTQLTKSAKWTNDDKTAAQIEIQAAYTPNQQMDFIFVLDTSTSMQLVNDENDASTAMGKMYQMLSKVSDVTDSLLSAKDIDSRVAFVSFGTGVGEASLGFYEKEHSEQADEIIRNLKIAGNNTDFAAGLEKAIEYINLAKKSNRNVSIVFLSDGEANQNTDRIDTVAKQIKALGVETIGVLYQNPSSDEEPEYMENACSKYYLAEDTEGFSHAINRTIYDAFRAFKLTDKISADFKAITNEAISVTGGTFQLSADGKTIFWDLSGTEPYQTYAMIIDVELAKDAEEHYPEKMIPTNDQTAVLAEIGSGDTVNHVDSPQLNRIRNITVSYQFIGNVPEGIIAPDSEMIKAGVEYTAKKSAEMEGWRFDGWYKDANCTIPFTDGMPLSDDTTLYGKWMKTTPVGPDRPVDPTEPDEPGQNPENQNPDSSTPAPSKDSPQTGDSKNLVLPLLFMGTGFFGMTSLVLKRKQKKKAKQNR